MYSGWCEGKGESVPEAASEAETPIKAVRFEWRATLVR